MDIQYFYTLPDVPVNISRVFFFLISDFVAEIFKANKASEKVHSFHNTVFFKKKITDFTNLNSLEIENNRIPQHRQKLF